MIAKYDEVNPAALKRLLADGAKLHGFSPAIMDACFNAAKELHAEIAKDNASFKKVYDSLMTTIPTTAISGSRSRNLATTPSWSATRAADRLVNANGPGTDVPGPFYFGRIVLLILRWLV